MPALHSLTDFDADHQRKFDFSYTCENILTFMNFTIFHPPPHPGQIICYFLSSVSQDTRQKIIFTTIFKNHKIIPARYPIRFLLRWRNMRYKIVSQTNTTKMKNIPMKIHMYINYCMFDTPRWILVQVIFFRITKSPKSQSLISLGLGGERGEKCKTNMITLQLSIIINILVHALSSG